MHYSAKPVLGLFSGRNTPVGARTPSGRMTPNHQLHSAEAIESIAKNPSVEEQEHAHHALPSHSIPENPIK